MEILPFTWKRTFPFKKLDDVLPLVKHGKINGNAVIRIA